MLRPPATEGGLWLRKEMMAPMEALTGSLIFGRAPPFSRITVMLGVRRFCSRGGNFHAAAAGKGIEVFLDVAWRRPGRIFAPESYRKSPVQSCHCRPQRDSGQDIEELYLEFFCSTCRQFSP